MSTTCTPSPRTDCMSREIRDTGFAAGKTGGAFNKPGTQNSRQALQPGKKATAKAVGFSQPKADFMQPGAGVSQPTAGVSQPSAPGAADPDVIVIGAGAAGMMAAVTAARAGASVTLFERGDREGKKAPDHRQGQM